MSTYWACSITATESIANLKKHFKPDALVSRTTANQLQSL
jgi:hypothetical protein